MHKKILGAFSGSRLKRFILRHSLAIVVFLVMSLLFMGKSLTGCSTTIISAPSGGDHLAGIIWLYTFTNAPYGGVSHVTNFPYGESVSQPQLITSALLLVPTWVLSEVIGDICAWNMMVFFGYMSSALVMYGFIYWLVRKRGVALFAGLGIAFTPYHYFVSMGHLSYLQSAIFIALLWAVLSFWGTPTRAKAVLLGSLTASLFYIDGYFPFIGGIMLFALLAYALLTDALKYINGTKKEPLIRIKYLLFTGAALILFLLPIYYVKSVYGSRIETSLSNSRSSVKEELLRYGAKPADYLLPSTDGPIPPVREAVQDYRKDHPHSEISEYSIYLGVTVIGLAAYATILALKDKIPGLGFRRVTSRWLVGACLSVVIVAGLFSLSPQLKAGGLTFVAPSELLDNYVSYWRVPSRLYLVVSIAAVTLASIGLYSLFIRIRNPKLKALVIPVATLLLVIELMPVNPLNRTDELTLSKTNATYRWIRDQKDITALAAYPMRPHPFNTSYFGDQVIHSKPLLNSYSASDPELYLHRALAGPADKQTLGVLKTLGVSDVLLYRVPFSAHIEGLSHRYGNLGARVSSINEDVRPLEHALVPLDGFNPPDVDPATQVACHKTLDLTANMTIRHLVNKRPEQNLPVSFVLRGDPGQSVIIYSKGKILTSASFNKVSEERLVKLSLADDQVITVYHISDRTKDYVAVCNLGSAK
jgi:hypothetical protein